MAISGILVAIFLFSYKFQRSICMMTKRGSALRLHFHCGNYQFSRREDLQPGSSGRSILFLSENNEIHLRKKGKRSVVSSSVAVLFETDGEVDLNDNEALVSSNLTSSEMNCDSKREDDNVHSVSDAEALLACWSFLKRRKRFGGWSECEERQAHSALSQNYFITDDEEGSISLIDDDDDDQFEIHDKLKEYKLHLNFVSTDEGDGSITTVHDLLMDSNPVNERREFVCNDPMNISSYNSDECGHTNTGDVRIGKNIATKNIDLWYTEFTSFPAEPSPSRIRRVDAMKRRWEDPAYRKRWHEKRWGSKSKHIKKTYEQQTEKERRAIQRARALPLGFLGSDELASMTEDEIADAIRIRIHSTRKRVKRRKQTLQKRKDVLAKQIEVLETLSKEDTGNHFDKNEASNLRREVLFPPTKETLEDTRQKRSERAKELYATRLRNQLHDKGSQPTEVSSSASISFSKTKLPTRNKGPFFPPKQLTPQDAFLRIENDLDHRIKPSIEDVRLVLEPRRMKNRKLLLRKILQDEFNLRGKCVPPSRRKDNEAVHSFYNRNDNEEEELEFVTHSTIERLGEFVICLLKKKSVHD